MCVWVGVCVDVSVSNTSKSCLHRTLIAIPRHPQLIFHSRCNSQFPRMKNQSGRCLHCVLQFHRRFPYKGLCFSITILQMSIQRPVFQWSGGRSLYKGLYSTVTNLQISMQKPVVNRSAGKRSGKAFSMFVSFD